MYPKYFVNEHLYRTKVNKAFLEKLDRENFAETQIVNHTGSIDVNSKSILALALQHEKQQKEAQLAIEKKDENILDATTLNLIEQKQD